MCCGAILVMSFGGVMVYPMMIMARIAYGMG
jgi:hypothetical protein